MTGGCLGEYVHGKTLVLCTVLVNNSLCNADHLKLGNAGLKVLDNLIGCKLDNTEALTDTSKLVLALDLTKCYHDVVALNDLSLGIGRLKALVDRESAFNVAAETDLDMLAGNTDRLEYVIERGSGKLGIGGICGLAELTENEDLLDLRPVLTENGGLGSYEKSRVSGCGDRNACALEERPEAGEVSRVGIIALGGGYEHYVKSLSTNECGSLLDSLLIFIIGNANSFHGYSLLYRFLFYFNTFFELCLYKIVNVWYNIVNKCSK